MADHAVAFVCVQNAGRSQMAAALTERELARRGLDDDVTVLSGGTDPAERVHPEVVEAMADIDVDVAGREPRELAPSDLDAADYVVTMGCSARDVCPATWRDENRDWGLDDPHGRSSEAVAAIRDEITRRVESLVDELESEI
ncbi:MAG: low molecular weight phosphatase family protein [Haloplanus sp.]